MLTYMGVELRRAQNAIEAVEDLVKVCRKTDVGESLEWISVFDRLRFAYGAVANVSKLLKPASNASGQRQETARELCKICELPGDHAIHSRSVRNTFEHLDERLEIWLDDPDNQYLFAELIDYGFELDIPMIRQAPIVFDVPSGMLLIMGDSFRLDELKSAVTSAFVHWQTGMQTFAKD